MADVSGVGVLFAVESNLVTAFTSGGRRCIRVGNRRGPRFDFPNTVQLVAPDKGAWLRAHVFRVSLSPEVMKRWKKQPQTYRVVAETREAVESYLKKRYTRIAHKYMGMAKFVLTEAMKRVSSRPVSKGGPIGEAAERVGLRNIQITSFGGASRWTVAIHDNLSYAAEAFRSGGNAVQIAMAKAANSIAGYLRKRAGDILDPSLATPFPEISKHRKLA